MNAQGVGKQVEEDSLEFVDIDRQRTCILTEAIAQQQRWRRRVIS